jgi:hypothetical protein
MKVICDLLKDQIGAYKVLLDTDTYHADKQYEYELDYTTLKSKRATFSFTEPMEDKAFEIVLRLEY